MLWTKDVNLTSQSNNFFEDHVPTTRGKPAALALYVPNPSQPPRLRPGYTIQSDPANLARKPYDDSRVLQEDHTQQSANNSLRTYYSSFQTVPATT
ncbi:unnamed protein product, partial [Tilletia controversa]